MYIEDWKCRVPFISACMMLAVVCICQDFDSDANPLMSLRTLHLMARCGDVEAFVGFC